MSDGLGIGLTLARRLAEMHGGAIEVHSEGEERGSEFILRLPLGLPPATAATEAHEDEALLPGMRILVVDDNHDAAATLAMALTLLNAEVRLVHNGQAALDAVGEFDPSAVLLDLGPIVGHRLVYDAQIFGIVKKTIVGVDLGVDARPELDCRLELCWPGKLGRTLWISGHRLQRQVATCGK